MSFCHPTKNRQYKGMEKLSVEKALEYVKRSGSCILIFSDGTIETISGGTVRTDFSRDGFWLCSFFFSEKSFEKASFPVWEEPYTVPQFPKVKLYHTIKGQIHLFI